MPTIGDALYQSSCQLHDAGIGSGSLEASLLLSQATGLDKLQLFVHTGDSIDESQWSAFQELLHRRLQREPIQYILGETEFMGLRFQVSPAVLIPRPDTEILVEAVLDLEEENPIKGPFSVADIGTGSGAIAIALAKSWPRAHIVAGDISPAAINVAKLNAERHQVQDAIAFVLGDGLSVLSEPVRYLVSNPPYIGQEDIEALDPEVRDYEPSQALTPGEDSLHWYRLFASRAAPFVQPGGYLAVEVGLGQAEDVVQLLEEAGPWEGIRVLEDMARIKRVVMARRRES